MKYICISNKGVLDSRLISLMGGTTKDKDKFKIGQFGTGLKYASAFCARNNIDFIIFCGTECFVLNTVQEEIAGEVFDIVYFNKERTGITNKMGQDWQPWMIMRELWCNALDEGDEQLSESTEPVGYPGRTSIYIQETPEFREVRQNWSKYFIMNQEPLHKGDIYSIYPGGNTLRLYKHGILIHEEKNDGWKSLFSYDIADADINELREFRGTVGMAVANALASCTSRAVIKYFYENITAETFEGNIDLDWWNDWSKAWKTELGSAKLIYQEAINNMQARGVEIDPASYVVVPKSVYKVLTRKLDGIGALYVADKSSHFMEAPHFETEAIVAHALEILQKCNYDLHPNVQYKFGWFEDATKWAVFNRKDQSISVSNTLADRGLLAAISTLIEEHEHAKTGYSDATRTFQDHLLTLYTRTLLECKGVNID